MKTYEDFDKAVKDWVAGYEKAIKDKVKEAEDIIKQGQAAGLDEDVMGVKFARASKELESALDG